MEQVMLGGSLGDRIKNMEVRRGTGVMKLISLLTLQWVDDITRRTAAGAVRFSNSERGLPSAGFQERDGGMT